MSREGTELYKAEVLRLREKYRDKIRVFLGIECDYLSDEPLGDYDYVIGSVHTVFKNGTRAEVDGGTPESRLANVNKLWGADQYAFVEDYFAAISDIYEKTHCDIIGHFDIVCKFNQKDKVFDENHPRYVAAAVGALDKLLKTPAVFEFNTGGVYRGYRDDFYPSELLLGRIADAGRPMIITSDTHNVDSVLFGYERAVKILDSFGIKYFDSMDDVLRITRGK
jgi:histidinol-phosphatase (PHP family)